MFFVINKVAPVANNTGYMYVPRTHMEHWKHRLNMEFDLQSLFGEHSCAHWLRPHTPIWTHIRGRCWSAKIDDISLCPPYGKDTILVQFEYTCRPKCIFYTERRKSKSVGMRWHCRLGETDPNRTTTKKSGLPLIYSLYEDTNTTLCGCWLRVDGIPV